MDVTGQLVLFVVPCQPEEPAVTPEQEQEATSLMRLAQAGDQLAYASLLVLLTSVTRQFR